MNTHIEKTDQARDRDFKRYFKISLCLSVVAAVVGGAVLLVCIVIFGRLNRLEEDLEDINKRVQQIEEHVGLKQMNQESGLRTESSYRHSDMSGPYYMGRFREAKKRMAKIGITNIESAVAEYYVDCGDFPTSIADLMEDPGGDIEGWDGPYLDPEDLQDPWKNPYYYEPPPSGSNKCVVISYGRDGELGGDDDIANQPLQ